MTSQDIRVWLREHGHQVGDRGAIKRDLLDEYEAAHNGDGEGASTEEEAPLLIVPDDPPVSHADTPDAAPSNGAAPRGEAAPRRTEGRRRRLMDRKPKDPTKTPARRLPRVSLENLIGSGWGLAAMALARNPNAVPVGRVMSMQAPVAGVVLDDVLKGTPVDRLLQPLARAGEKGEIVFALAGPPLITGAITAHPEWYPALRPMLKMSLMSWMAISAPAMRKAQQRAERMTGEFGVTDAELDGMIEALFSDVNLPTAASADEEDAIRRARGE